VNHDLARAILHSQTHRRMIDPITFAKRKTPFVIERVGMVPVEQKKAEGGK